MAVAATAVAVAATAVVVVVVVVVVVARRENPAAWQENQSCHTRGTRLVWKRSSGGVVGEKRGWRVAGRREVGK